jgi:hypothetical protein
MRLVIEVDDPEIVVQLRSAGKTAPTTGAAPKAEGADGTEAKDAGAAPSAPTLGPLVNVSQTATPPDRGKQLPAAGDSTGPKAKQPKSSSAETYNEVPMIDAGSPSADILAHTAPTLIGREN